MPVAVVACAVGTAAIVLLLATGPGYRTGMFPLPLAFNLFRWAAYAGLAAIVLGLIGAVLSYRAGARTGVLLSVLALACGLVAFGIPFSWQRSVGKVPRIHDISTDTVNPPAFDAVVPLRANAPNSLDYSQEVASQQRAGYPDITTLQLALPPTQAFERALSSARDAEWEIVKVDETGLRIEGTDTTTWFGFKDDIVVRLTPDGTGTRVDVRSVSRVGLSDVGTNARRIRNYLRRVSAG